jgi:excinuclease ABC subunit C
MRARRASVRTGASKLEDIPGVGPKKRAKLLQRFGGVRGVGHASIEDLSTVDGVSRELAEEIYRALH